MIFEDTIAQGSLSSTLSSLISRHLLHVLYTALGGFPVCSYCKSNTQHMVSLCHDSLEECEAMAIRFMRNNARNIYLSKDSRRPRWMTSRCDSHTLLHLFIRRLVQFQQFSMAVAYPIKEFLTNLLTYIPTT